MDLPTILTPRLSISLAAGIGLAIAGCTYDPAKFTTRDNPFDTGNPGRPVLSVSSARLTGGAIYITVNNSGSQTTPNLTARIWDASYGNYDDTNIRYSPVSVGQISGGGSKTFPDSAIWRFPHPDWPAGASPGPRKVRLDLLPDGGGKWNFYSVDIPVNASGASTLP